MHHLKAQLYKNKKIKVLASNQISIPFAPHEYAQDMRSGKYGAYLKISRDHGIKFLFDDNWETKKEAARSSLCDSLRQEEKMLKLARTCYKHVPIAGKIIYAFSRETERWHVGLLQQHIKGKHLPYLDTYRTGNFWRIFEDILATSGIFHEDLHNNNVLIHKRTVHILDFSPSYVSVYRSFKSRSSCLVNNMLMELIDKFAQAQANK